MSAFVEGGGVGVGVGVGGDGATHELAGQQEPANRVTSLADLLTAPPGHLAAQLVRRSGAPAVEARGTSRTALSSPPSPWAMVK